MRQPRRRAMVLIALLTAASLAMTPRVGGAAWPRLMTRYPDQLPGDMFGEPDIPPTGRPLAVKLPLIKIQVELLGAPQLTLVVLPATHVYQRLAHPQSGQGGRHRGR
jgi:hypothetical protein